ncbi:bifunctional 3,4-dihydroxy-2-butanone-4-phosphate synthase/GTP cyclohydrolase II [Isoptericola variabilis]|uniref:Riboflavin biosynthesis protein RibBA n=1 Tax=Isoptericola variabilis (strain 225) TaxID=743718 RepID=F6FUE1_ISOV2|nr:bifunctional 3,4-dihydroxy-2-butanone-4-phosphate synthase/GTP cyclohydrolase II [Isoptericola variabilis]AEG44269.1 GTP cyclohydrolase-2 [Isoptericola variabilis 225]TWH28411.1 3,4-dihydroxy 2-butanone 4-phosphate synthase/GTP cyclohydrolase II [Isoptericola variabilis J7]
MSPHGPDAQARVERAIADVAAGRPVVVVDDHDRENEGDLILAAATVTPETMAFTIRYTSGLICVPASGEILDRLQLPLMVTENRDQYRTAYTITVDAATGVGTGISAADRTRTAHVLADPAARASDLTRPGHVLPLRARPGGVLERRGHTEAAVDLARLAGLPEAGVLAELTHDDGTLMRLPALVEFAAEHDLVLISVEELAAYRRRTETLVERVAATRLPTRHGDLTAVAYRDVTDGVEHVALVAGPLPAPGEAVGEPVLARVHSECLTGDAFGSVRCDCGPQLDAALDRIVAEGRGVVVYVRGHEGRGIGLAAKLVAYALQDAGRDTVDANLEQGLPADAREYTVAAQILRDLGMPTVRLLTNNPAKVTGLEAGGATVVERLPLALPPDPRHLAYLRTKRDRMGHDLPHLEAPVPAAEPTQGETMDARLAAVATLEATR